MIVIKQINIDLNDLDLYITSVIQLVVHFRTDLIFFSMKKIHELFHIHLLLTMKLRRLQTKNPILQSEYKFHLKLNALLLENPTKLNQSQSFQSEQYQQQSKTISIFYSITNLIYNSMREKFKQHLAEVCHIYPKRSLLYWIGFLSLQQCCFLAPLLRLLPAADPQQPMTFIAQHSLLTVSLSHLCVGLSQFLFWPLCTTLGLIILTLVTGPLKRSPSIHCLLYEWMPLYCPLYIWFSLIVFKYSSGIGQMACCCAVGFTAIGLWVFQINLVAAPFTHLNARLQKIPDLLEVGIFVVCCIVSLYVSQATIIITILQFLLLGFKLFLFGFLSEELEYVRFCGSFAKIIICLVESIQDNMGDQISEGILIAIAITVVLERLTFIRLIFGMKYVRLLRKDYKEVTIPELILTYNLIDKHLIKMETTNYFQFYLQAGYSSASTEISEMDAYLTEKSKKSIELGLYTICKQIEKGQYLKASVCGGFLYPLKNSCSDNIRLLTMDKILEQCKKRMTQYNINDTKIICTLNKVNMEVNLESVFKAQQLLQKVISKIMHCLENINAMIKKLLSGSMAESQTYLMLQNIRTSKESVEALFQKHQSILYTYDGLMSYYLFLNVCKAQKYSIMDTLQNHFQRIFFESQLDVKIAPANIICIVSGQIEQIGTILNTNNAMKVYFSMNEQKILHKTLNISVVMPKCIGQLHGDIMLDFIRTGSSKKIGRIQKGFAIRKGNICRMDIFVKMTSFMNGLVFAGSMTPVQTSDSYAICDKNWDIEQTSANIVEYFKWKPSCDPNIINLSKPIYVRPKNEWSSQQQKGDKVLFSLNGRSLHAQLYSFPVASHQFNICKFLECPISIQYSKSKYKILQSQTRQHANANNNKLISSERNKRFCDVQTNISNQKLWNNWTPYLFIGYILVWITVTFGLVWMNNQISDLTTKTIAMVTTASSTAPMIRAQTFEVMSEVALLAGIFKGVIPENIAMRFGIPKYVQYIQNTSLGFLTETLTVQQMILDRGESYTPQFIEILRKRIFGEYSAVPPLMLMQLQTDLGFKKNMFFDVFTMSKTVFLLSWPTIKGRMEFVQNFETFQQIKTTDSIMVEGTFQAVQALDYNINNQIIIFCVLIISSGILYFYVFFRMMAKCRVYIELFKYLDSSCLRAKLSKNNYAESILNTIKKQNITSFQVEQNNIAVQIHGTVYNFKKGNILEDQDQLRKKLNVNAKQKRDIPRQTQLWRQFFGWFPMVAILILSFAYFFEIISSNLKRQDSLQRFFTIDTSMSALQVSELAFFYISITRFVNANQSLAIFGLPADEVYTRMKYNVFHRDYEQLFISNPEWYNFTSNLYQSKCKPNDTLCPKVLSGAVTGGWSSSIIQLTASIQQLYEAVKRTNLSTEQREYIINLIIELHYAYNEYIRPQINELKKFNFQMMSKGFNDDIKFRHELMCFSIPTLMIVLAILLCGVVESSHRLRMVISEVFSIDTIDFLYTNMHFSFELLRI